MEPLSVSFNKNFLYGICKNSDLSIKKLIMDQKKLVGVGNIYASESLFLAKILPTKKAKKISIDECDKLVKSIKKVLRYAIKMGGTTLKDFYSPNGNQGYFKFKLNVYGRDDKQCRLCGNNIKKMKIGQRATYSCNKCQN